jgi:hypothetical protein
MSESEELSGMLRQLELSDLNSQVMSITSLHVTPGVVP